MIFIYHHPMMNLSSDMYLFLPRLFSLFFFFFFLFMIISFGQQVDKYKECDEKSFNCGDLKDVNYPFYGGDRPDYCGHPGFQLRCQDKGVPLITMGEVEYQVLEIMDNETKFKVAREDLWDGLCKPSPHNTSFDPNLFNYSIQYPNITIYQNCSVFGSYIPPNQFCYSPPNFSFYLPTSISFWEDYATHMSCQNNITIPVLPDVFSGLSSLSSSMEDLRAALQDGFELLWSANNQQCRVCVGVGSGGQCGYNTVNSTFACYCPDGVYDGVKCPSKGSEGISKIAIGLAVAGAVIAALGVFCLVLFCRKRSKRVAAAKASLSPEAASKEIITTTSSKPLISSTTSSSFTKSIPSYPTSNSDLGHQSSYFGVQIFNYAELEEATDNFSASRELGDGGFGAVYYGTLADGRVVAVKRLYENNFRRQEQFMNEVKILAEVRHRNLVHLYGCTPKRSRDLLLVYEYIPNGTVADHLHGNRAKSGLLSWPVRLKIAIETAEALAYLHKNAIIHRDVKTTNILLDNEFTVKVADFGLSRLFPKDVTHVSTAPQGTPGYVDPEYYQVYHLTEKSDVFSFGVVLVELISSLQAVDVSRHRHDINLANMAVNKIQSNAAHELVDKGLGFETSDSVRRMTLLVAELAFRCLQQERDMRPSMEEILEALRGIENGEAKAEVKEEFMEILVDDVALLKGNFGTPSPDKSAKSSTNNSA